MPVIPTQVQSIGDRLLAGRLRVDTVQQGDLDGVNGVYHINLVDEVTQWQMVACVAAITQSHLRPVLQDLLERFPFPIRGFIPITARSSSTIRSLDYCEIF
ncbi:MAG: hypothetical protein M3N93_04695 [Acidobacteriota bacterium]|nr:hypothetical protein [Acidobacteriota bacterium]